MIKKIIAGVIFVVAAAIVTINIMDMSSEKEASEEQGIVSSIPDGETASEVSDEGIGEGDTAPDFTLQTLEGEELTLSDFRGEKVILNFWATWCPPCIAEMPHMQSFYEKQQENGVEIVAVNLTHIDSGDEAIRSFINDFELTFHIPLDKEGEIAHVYQAFTVPTSYIIDTDGKIAKKIVGPMDEAMMEDLIGAVN